MLVPILGPGIKVGTGAGAIELGEEVAMGFAVDGLSSGIVIVGISGFREVWSGKLHGLLQPRPSGSGLNAGSDQKELKNYRSSW